MMDREKQSKVLYAELSYAITGVCFDVYNALGPGFTEDIYHNAVLIELEERGLKYETEKPVDVYYKGKLLGKYRMDLVIEGKIVLELKAVTVMNDIYKAQVKSYLKATGLRLGLLVNFGGKEIKPERVLN
jgi:GxxExxY protein